MTADQLPVDGELRLGPVTLPAGQRLFTFAPEPVVWATNQPVPEPGRLWSQLSALLPVTGLDQLDPADVLAHGWGSYLSEDQDEESAAEIAPFTWQFPGLAAPEHTRLGEAELQRALGSLPPARIGLVPATRPADVLAVLHWVTTDQYPDPLPLSAVLRSWEDRFGARLLEVGDAAIKLFAERPPHDLEAAWHVAAEHYAFCDECAGHTGLARTTIPEIAPALVNSAVWSFWWD
jgi:Domain of unknown function (DUF4253)